MMSPRRPGNAFGGVGERSYDEHGLPIDLRKAQNLLVKAHRAMLTGDHARAAKLIDTSAALPRDDFERYFPAIMSAQYLLYGSLRDAAEACLGGDDSWIDAVESALESHSVSGQELAGALRDFAMDGERSPREVSRMHGLLQEFPPHPLYNHEDDLDHERRVEKITTILQAWVAFEQKPRSGATT